MKCYSEYLIRCVKMHQEASEGTMRLLPVK